jgi:hypothetical protein
MVAPSCPETTKNASGLIVDHPAGRRGRRQAGVEGAEVEAGARGEVEPYTGARGNELERRPDPRAAFGVAHDLEPGRLARLLGGGEQRFELRRRQRPAGRRFDARLESEDRVARSLAEVAVAHAIVESQPHERVLRGLAGRFRQSQERRLLRGERRVGCGRRRLGRGGRSRKGQERQDEGRASRAEHGCSLIEEPRECYPAAADTSNCRNA